MSIQNNCEYNPLISIITPAYNASKVIEETVNSVLAQTFNDWEMIIVDDCSTDNTYELALKLAKSDKRIKVLKNEKNSGVAVTRNVALDSAQGKYIAFLDSDDMWMPNKLSVQFEYMEKNDLAFTYTSYQIYDSNTKQKGKVISVPDSMTAKRIYSNTAIACLTVMVNREKVGMFHMPNIIHAEDQSTWQDILNRGYIGVGINENLALYRVGNASLTSNKFNAAKKQWEVYRNHHKFSFVKSAYYFIGYAINAVYKLL